jgi:galactose mutarotase-like enzyme
MFDVERREGPIPTLVLSDSEGPSTATLAPARGGMMIGLAVGGHDGGDPHAPPRELLYLDRQTFEDPSANVRGGAPVLFPSPGKLTGDAWSWGGAHGTLRQHGFARNLPWDVAATGTDDGAWAKLELVASATTRANYPWDFRASLTYRLRGRALAIEIEVENEDRSPMPFGTGFHPYFAVRDADKSRVRIASKATRAFDNAAKQEIAFKGFDLTAAEVDLHLLDHGSTDASLILDDLTILIRGSAEITRWVVWTLRGRDFVCVEPWTCPGNALNTGDELIVLGPGETRRMRVEIVRGG